MNETRQLSRFVVETKFEDLPPSLIEYAKTCVLDNLASSLVGSVQPWSKMVAEMIREGGGNEDCTIFGREWRMNQSGATLVNGLAIGAFETDHGSLAASGHPGGSVFPAAIAVAERERKDGKSFLTAMILGYETTCRIGEAATRAVEDERGYHGPGTNGQFGAAAAVGKLLRFDEGTLTNALGIAGSHSAGLLEYVWEGAMTKRIHLGRSAQMGLECAVLAGKGFTGPSTVLEGKHGFFNVFSPSPEPERLLANIGNEWLSTKLRMKRFASHGSHQNFITGVLEFKSQHHIDAKDIRRISVSTVGRILHKHDDREPKSVMGLQFSLPFVVAAALIKDVANPYNVNEETLWDKDVRALAQKVETVVDEQRFNTADDPPHGEIIIELGSTKHVISVGTCKGSPGNPFNFDDACEKFRRFGNAIIGKKRAEEVIQKVLDIEQLDNMGELARMMGT